MSKPNKMKEKNLNPPKNPKNPKKKTKKRNAAKDPFFLSLFFINEFA